MRYPRVRCDSERYSESHHRHVGISILVCKSRCSLLPSDKREGVVSAKQERKVLCETRRQRDIR